MRFRRRPDHSDELAELRSEVDAWRREANAWRTFAEALTARYVAIRERPVIDYPVGEPYPLQPRKEPPC